MGVRTQTCSSADASDSRPGPSSSLLPAATLAPAAVVVAEAAPPADVLDGRAAASSLRAREGSVHLRMRCCNKPSCEAAAGGGRGTRGEPKGNQRGTRGRRKCVCLCMSVCACACVWTWCSVACGEEGYHRGSRRLFGRPGPRRRRSSCALSAPPSCRASLELGVRPEGVDELGMRPQAFVLRASAQAAPCERWRTCWRASR